MLCDPPMTASTSAISASSLKWTFLYASQSMAMPSEWIIIPGYMSSFAGWMCRPRSPNPTSVSGMGMLSALRSSRTRIRRRATSGWTHSSCGPNGTIAR